MAMLNKDFFVEGSVPELDLFDLPPTQIAFENIKMESIQPVTTISNDSPIIFNISAQNGMEYLDMMRCQIRHDEMSDVRSAKSQTQRWNSSNYR